MHHLKGALLMMIKVRCVNNSYLICRYQQRLFFAEFSGNLFTSRGVTVEGNVVCSVSGKVMGSVLQGQVMLIPA